jgi:Utp21 specific WD40 associated putative domain
VTNIPFLALEDLSALVAHDRFQDTSSPMPDLDGDIVTLTLLPRSRWQTLLNLDVIQVSFYTFLFLFLHTHNSDK